MATVETTGIICDALRRAGVAWSGGDDAQAIAQFIAAGRRHGVLPLLDAALRDQDWRETWPTSIVTACREAARAQAMVELAHRGEIGRVLDALASAGAAPLLLKGAALAYSHYPNAALRPRADTDLLIPRDRRIAAARALASLGYVEATGIEGEFVSHQSAWSRSDRLGAVHHVDLHWRINNSPMLARVLDYRELAARALPLSALGRNARAPAPVHALLLACVHRAGHANAPYVVDGVAISGGDRLVWLYDIHLLVSRMSAAELDAFAALAEARQVRALCAAALRRTRECFATPVPAALSAALDRPGPVEISARYLAGGRARQMLGDFLALDRWSERRGWIREVVFPSERYMRAMYADTGVRWLPALYARRALEGVARLVFARDARSQL